MSLKRYNYPVQRISEIISGYIGDDFLSIVNKCSIRSIVNSIYRPESKVWKTYISNTEYQFDDLSISMAQNEFFYRIAENKKNCFLVIEECFSMIKDIQNEIYKCTENGTYTKDQAIAITGILLTDFARSVFTDSNLKIAYFYNRSFVEFYTFHWNRFDSYKKRTWDNMSEDDLLKSLRESL